MATATIIPNAKLQFEDINGKPLVAGTVGMYVPSTLTPKNTWQDSGEAVLNTNPVILDSRGQALIYGNGDYRQILKDSVGNLIWDQVVSAPPAASITPVQTIGTWTPVDASGAALVFTSVSAGYTQLGNMMFAYATFTFPTTVSGATALIGGLPGTAANHGYAEQGALSYANTATSVVFAKPLINSTTFEFYGIAGGAATNANMSTAIVFINMI